MQQNSSKSNEGEISWRSLQTNNGHVEAEEAKVYEAKIDNVAKTHAKSYDAIQEEALPENVRGNVKELRIVIDQLHLNFIQAGELILEIARRLDEDHVVKQDQICRKIKEFLKDKIQERKISEGWIEECLPTEYKRKYKGKPKSQLNHLLKHRPEQQVAVTQDGKSETKDEIAPQVIKSYREQQGIEDNPVATQIVDSKPEQDIEYSDTDLTSVSTSIEQEPAAANAQPQESQVDPDQVLQETSHEIRILLSRDSLSEQIARVDSPGIEWVWLSGVMDEKSRIVSNLKLERGELFK
jgi:hypothetical protein